MNAPKKRVQLMLDHQSYDRLKELADASKRTVPGYIRWMIHCYLYERDAGIPVILE